MKKISTCIILVWALLLQAVPTQAMAGYSYTELIPPQYQWVVLKFLPDGEAYYQVKNNDLLGLIDANGQEILPCQYKYISDTYIPYGYLWVETESQYLLLDETLQPVLNGVYEDCMPLIYTDHLFKVSQNGLWGVADKDNNILIPLEYQGIGQVYPQEDGGWWMNAYTQRDYVVTDQNNKVLFSTQLMNVTYPASFYSYLSGRLLVTKDHPAGTGLQDYYNIYDIATGERLAASEGYIPAADPLKPSDDGLLFTVGNQFVLDSNGDVVVEKGLFDSIGTFLKGRTIASKDGQEYIIDTAGNILALWPAVSRYKSGELENIVQTISPEHSLYASSNGLFATTDINYNYIFLYKDGFAGVWDAYGNELLPMEYSTVAMAGKDRFFVEKNCSPALISANGEQLIPFGQYDSIHYLFADFFFCSKDGESVIINIQSGETINMGYSLYSLHKDRTGSACFVSIFNAAGEQGLAAIDGTMIVPFGEYDFFTSIVYPLYFVVERDGKQGIITVENSLFQTASFAPSFWAEELLNQAAKASFVPLSYISGYQNHLSKDDFFLLLENIVVQKTGQKARDLYFDEWEYSMSDAVMPQDIYSHHNAAAIYPFIMAPENEPRLFYPDATITKEEICLLLEQLAATLESNVPPRSLYIDETPENLKKTATWEEAIIIAYKFYLAL